ncbi:MAG: hypothetical protein HY782_19145 [Chloroflexi bacterium]|nr:hypothetical protein [Chloroflexota bacterium]
MRNILIFIFLLVLALALLAFAQPRAVQKPVKDGAGPLAVKLDPRLVAPEYHSPMEWWRTHHMDAVTRGDFAEADCLHCHDATTSCNNCHSYVGVRQIEQKD